MYFYSLFKTLLGRQETKISYRTDGFIKGRLTALKHMKTDNIKGGGYKKVWSTIKLSWCFTGYCLYSRPDTLTSKHKQPYYLGYLEWCVEKGNTEWGQDLATCIQWNGLILSCPLCVVLPTIPCRCWKSQTNGFIHRGLGRPWGIWFKICFVHKGSWYYVHNGNCLLT